MEDHHLEVINRGLEAEIYRLKALLDSYMKLFLTADSLIDAMGHFIPDAVEVYKKTKQEELKNVQV